MPDSMTYETIFDPDQEVIQPIDRGLHEFNVAHLGEDVIMNYHTLAVISRNSKGDVIGGIHGELIWGWFYIKSLWVQDNYRGFDIGKRLLLLAEEAAASKGIFKAHLETTGFQALGFYLKQGYEIFGKLEGKPAGTTWYFLKKDSTPEDKRPHEDDLRDF